jgi:hypothetical protein
MTKVVAAVFALFGAYVLSAVYAQPHWFGMVLAAAALAAAGGLWSKRSWSQYFVYGVSFVVAGQWLWLTLSYYFRVGWPTEKIFGHIVALVPGLCVVTLAIGSSIVAFRCFRAQS